MKDFLIEKMYEETCDSKTIFDGKIISVEHNTVRLSDGSLAKREIVRHSGGCCMLGLTDDNCILLVKQFRNPYGEVIYEIPAGKLNHGENPMDCAIREMEEETGYIPNNVEDWGGIFPTPAYCSEIIHLFFSKDLTKCEQKLDDGEFLNVEKMPFEKALSLVLDNTIKDAKTQIAILRLYQKLHS